MKIGLLGEYSGDLDEGMRIVSWHFAKELGKNHQVLALDLRNAFTKSFWVDVKKFKPEIIHYIHGPSVKSFVLLKITSFYCRGAETVMSAIHPDFSFLSELFIPLFKPNLILTQSFDSEEMFKKLGCKTKFLPCGVDIKKFTPDASRSKVKLREKYGIDEAKFIVLHIGSIKEGRNVWLMEKLQKENIQVVIVGAISPGLDKDLIKELKKTGCLVWAKHFENIEEIYLLSDCYIFPTSPANKINAIEMPLTVLEAMACNLPVIATSFGALPRVFEGGDGLFFVETEEDIFVAIEEIKKGTTVKTREKVMPYSWDNVGKKLEESYYSLIGGSK